MIRLFPNAGGWLEVVCGPMFSGKSEELIRRLRRAEIAGQRVLIVKPQIDNRYDIGHVVTHAGAKMRAVAVDDRRPTSRALSRATTSSASTRCSSSRREIVLILDGLVEKGMRVLVLRPRPGLPRLSVRPDAGAALPRGARRQAAGGLPPLRRPGDDDAAARRRLRPLPRTARRSSSARSSSTRRAAAAATSSRRRPSRPADA